MWESPIDITYGKLQLQLERNVCKAVQQVDIKVDKKELIKALEYDRDQYMKGYLDGELECLDKIRAEIELQRKEASNKNSEDDKLQAYYFGLNDGLKDARDILDKYKIESEVE